MKKFFKKIVDFFKSLFEVIDENIEEIEPEIEEESPEIVDEIEIEEVPEVKPETPVVQEPEIVPEPEPKEEVYVMLTNKERQTYFKELGLYTISIDNVRGPKQKLAEKIFNTIFLNKLEDTYTEATDKMLREIYASYKASKYMTDSDWKYFKNFKKSEFYCTCKKKYCDGYNGLENKLPMRLVMVLQYVRNYYGKAVKLTSTIRCKTRNSQVGGITKSKHMEFRAADNNVKDVKANDVVKLVYKGTNKVPFVKYAYAITDNESHIDVEI